MNFQILFEYQKRLLVWFLNLFILGLGLVFLIFFIARLYAVILYISLSLFCLLIAIILMFLIFLNLFCPIISIFLIFLLYFKLQFMRFSQILIRDLAIFIIFQSRLFISFTKFI